MTEVSSNVELNVLEEKMYALIAAKFQAHALHNVRLSQLVHLKLEPTKIGSLM